jgi:hypothetical protein
LLGGSPEGLKLLTGEGLKGGRFGLMAPGQSGTSSSSGSSSSGSSGSSSSTSTSSSANPLQTDFQTLQTDTEAILAKSQVTVAQLTAVTVDFQKLASEATSKPDQSKLTTLANDIQALNGQLPTTTQASQLQADYTAVLQSEGITDTTLIAQTIADINTVVQASNITAADLSKLAADETAIKNDLPAKGPATWGGGPPSGMGFFPHGPMGDPFGHGPMGGRFGGSWQG